MPDREPIGVIGTGYVGLATAAGFAELGSEVWCVDIDAHKIARLRAGEMPLYEPGLGELLAKHSHRVHFSTANSDALEHARLLFCAVGTPPTHSGDADLTAVHAVVDSITAAAGSGSGARHAVVMKSTVPCGTGATIVRTLSDSQRAVVSYVSCPEFLKEGTAVKDFLHPDRVVVGDGGGWAGDAVVALYSPLLAAEYGGAGSAALVRTDVASAEMIKLAANAFLATKISFINEIANVCEETGADVVEVARGMGLDERIGPKFLHAGIGYGGSCFTKDVSALKLLAGNSGYHFLLLAAVIEVNELQKRRVVAKLQRHLGSLAGRRVALLGLAFKPNTDDMRGAASLVLAARLQAEGVHVQVFDPVAEAGARELMPALEYAGSAMEAVEGADAAVLVTEWPEFITLDWREVADAMTGDLIIDGRNALDPSAIAAAGLRYEGIGHAAASQPVSANRDTPLVAGAAASGS
jgi:UDPglucose 6-dehydrogenase